MLVSAQRHDDDRAIAFHRFNDIYPLLRLHRLDDAERAIVFCEEVAGRTGDLRAATKAAYSRAALLNSRGEPLRAADHGRATLTTLYRIQDLSTIAEQHDDIARYLSNAGAGPATGCPITWPRQQSATCRASRSGRSHLSPRHSAMRHAAGSTRCAMLSGPRTVRGSGDSSTNWRPGGRRGRTEGAARGGRGAARPDRPRPAVAPDSRRSQPLSTATEPPPNARTAGWPIRRPPPSGR